MKTEVFPTIQALTVESGKGFVILSQYDDVRGGDATIYIPVAQVTATCAAIKAVAKESHGGE
ncbi:hypothetical protein LDO31_02895 [Luteimonas sp. XNQY3]|nr:hypothetical protein [Luteimonas sp. XNQY3]MCD9005194.1 hypothetical protein [Luteimonas sp. XNQY3]